MLTFLPAWSTFMPCTWCGLALNEYTYQVICDDTTGWTCLECLVMRLAPAQPLHFRDHTRHWLTALRQQLVAIPTPAGNPEEARTWGQQVQVMLDAIDTALTQAKE
jgi:hypothetical protein